MSVKNLGLIALGGFLVFATAPAAPAQHDLPGKSGATQTDKGNSGTYDRGTQSTESKSGRSTDKQASGVEQNRKDSTTRAEAQSSDNKTTADQKTTAHKSAMSKKGKSATSQSSANGMAKQQVHDVQMALKGQGFYVGPVNGAMNADTMTAIRNYQSHNHLEVTGKLDAQTQSSLGVHGGSAGSGVSQNNTFGSNQGRSSDLTQNQGFSSQQGREKSADMSLSRDDVMQIQRALRDWEYNPGQANGVMSQQTKQAIREFQLLNGLPVTGVADDATKSALLSSQGSHSSDAISQTQQKSDVPTERSKPDASTDSELQSNHSSDNSQSQTSADLNHSESSTDLTAKENKSDQTARMKSDANTDVQSSQSLDQSNQSQSSTDLSTNENKNENKSDDQSARMKGDVSGDVQQNGSQADTQWSQNQTTQDHSGRSDEHHANVDSKTSDKGHDLAKTDTKSDKDKSDTKKVDNDAADRAQKAADVLQELMGTPDKRIPNELLSRAEAIAVIPHVVKGALGIGGRYGKGLVSQRLEGGRWGTPAFIQIGGGSFGAQIGVSATDLVLVFTDSKALDMLAGGKDLKLGVDAGVVAGPIGRSAEAGVNAKLDTAIYAYSRSKGLFAGVALDGAVLDIDNSENKDVYGDTSAKSILSGSTMNSSVRPFMDALQKVMPKKISQK